MMFRLISKRKIIGIIESLNDSQDTGLATEKNDFYWRSGNANAINYICYKLGIANPCALNASPGDRMDGGKCHETD